MAVVVDASLVVALLVDSGPVGTWAESVVEGQRLASPHQLPAEVANVLRRSVAAGHLSADAGSLAFADLGDLDVELFPFAPFADRVWELRGSVTAYDAWYVAVAEKLDVPLGTLDRRLTRAAGVTCRTLVPEG